MTRLHLVDGTFELFRAHFAPRPGQRDASGRDVKATVGLASSLLQLLEDEEEAVSHIAVAFDNPVESFRNDLFDGYKTGEGMPEELAAQFDAAERATAALGVTVWSMDRYEADDALASGAARFRDQVEQVRLMTPDKDLGQSIRGTRVVQIDRMRKRLTNEKTLRELRGVGPASIPDWLGLMGDSADGIPGIPGFGAKSAAAVLAHYERIEAIPEDAADWEVAVRGAKRLAGNLAARRDEALLYKRLATLAEDAPISRSLAELEWRGVPRGAFEDFCAEMNADRLRSRPRRWAD
ncbi:MAG: flap endonuclease [Myxococcales bacterium]|nr:flap endonuclease [Myxococcales bacterium]